MNRNRLLTLLGIVLLAFVGYAAYVASSPPGREVTVDEGDRPEPTPIVVSPLEPLRTPWDSEAYAGWPVAELLASMSEASYLPPVDVAPSFRALGFTEVMPVVDGSMIGYVASANDMMVIVFRGTDNNIDWIVNLAALSIPTPNGPLHKGFYNAYQPLKPQIVKLVSASKPKHLWITGHSLGGALAVVCAYDLIENEHLDLDGVITFGQPMVASKQLAVYLDEVLLGRFAHYVNGHDIVARIPPNYSHFGSLVWFADDGVKRSKPKRIALWSGPDEPKAIEGEEIAPLSEREFEELKAELRADAEPVDREWQSYKGSSRWLLDHGMERYLEKVRSATRSHGAAP